MAALGSAALVHGGIRGSKWLADLHSLDLDTFRWRQVRPAGTAPSKRCYHSAVTVADEAVVFFGGNDADASFNDVIVLRTATASGSWRWERPETTGDAPAPRTGHSATMVSPRHMAVVGGWDPSNTVVERAGRKEASDEAAPAADADGDRPDAPIPTPMGGPMFPDVHILDVESWQWRRLQLGHGEARLGSAEGARLLPREALARTGHAAVMSNSVCLPGGQPAEPCLLVIGGVGPDERRRLDTVAIRLPDDVLAARAAQHC
ncbi:hypothetical protein FNF27_02117 [Cafeteria roenbergensis]|nr:hypothetical protein FNF27_02117 [Cafeteria roenbergensis]